MSVVPYPVPTTSTQWQSFYGGATSTESCLYYDKYGNLNVELTLNGNAILPDYMSLAREVQRHPTAPINISLWHWPAIELSLSLQPHMSLLWSVFHRWHTARFDIPLLNYLMKKTSWMDAERPRPHYFTSLMIRNIGKAGELAPSLTRLITVLLCNRYASLHRIDICDSGYTMPPLKYLAKIPFENLTSIRFLDTRCSAAQAHEILQGSLNVREFYATAITGPNPRAEVFVAACVNLRVLNIQLDELDFDRDDFGHVFALLDRIAAPDLEQLTLGYESDWSSTHFAEFYVAVQPRIRKLHLHKMRLNEVQLMNALRLNEDIEELILDGQEDHWRGAPPPLLFSERSCPFYMTNPNGYLIPDLKNLTVRDNCIDESGSFGQLVRDRFKHDNLKEVVILGEPDGKGLCREDRKILQYLSSKGLRLSFLESLPEASC
ncbi:hypothetical protein JR316_0013075 [Psilocybe cubensis]|uniref:Uncharacterized protein n=2 Tax=Psilocybe cubensis TaxID=181762 RepID=A0ACB8GHC6_PSICU|nr:hypothetical protein JR316_0013075 [Psilocybe cubensis]KAH9474611.1 hypothetical protein JR316_0013075 [Psilocybe cubensis]